METVFNSAKKITKKASNYILNNLHRKKVFHKQGHFNLVTNIDEEVEELVVKEIKKSFPKHTIIGEESGTHKKDSKYEWFIDPIDGTTNFAHGYPFFAISIGFAINGVLQFGIVMNPATNELFTGLKGKGAMLNNKPIKVSKIKSLKDSLLSSGFSNKRKNLKSVNFGNFTNLTLNSHGVRRDGAASLDLCYVACGRTEGFWEGKLSPWDTAAGVIILEEAGGKVTTYDGKKYSVYSDTILATNGHIHKKLMTTLK